MQKDIQIKFCVIGDQGVGKTSMLYQYIYHKFDETIQATIGCDFSTKLKSTVNGKQVRMQIWDIAGQERFNSVSKMYLRGALGCIIVCSATEENSLESTLKWKKLVEENSDHNLGKQIPFILVQNKSDLIIPEQNIEFQKLSYLRQFSQKNGFCECVQTSAKNNQNVESVFQKLLDQAMTRDLIIDKNEKMGSKSHKNQNNITLVYSQVEDDAHKKKKKCC